MRLIDLLESPGNYGEELENCQNGENFFAGIARFVLASIDGFLSATAFSCTRSVSLSSRRERNWR
jgi:hypothetical protein